MMMPHEIALRWVDIIDIAIVSMVIYYLLMWLQGTRAITLLKGIGVIFMFYLFGKVLNLYTINWLLERLGTVILILIIIIFQPELRRALERIGRGKLLIRLGVVDQSRGSWFVRHIIRAVESLSQTKTGALIVLERNTGLSEFLESGIKIDAVVSVELLLSIFSPHNPLHDGAVILQGDRIAAASCLLPLSDSRLLDKRLGTRHRAAVGMSEQSDALVIVVSERNGVISIADNGLLSRQITKEVLEEKLFELYKVKPLRATLFPWMAKHKK